MQERKGIHEHRESSSNTSTAVTQEVVGGKERFKIKKYVLQQRKNKDRQWSEFTTNTIISRGFLIFEIES